MLFTWSNSNSPETCGPLSLPCSRNSSDLFTESLSNAGLYFMWAPWKLESTVLLQCHANGDS